jgi:hypothetical protein
MKRIISAAVLTAALLMLAMALLAKDITCPIDKLVSTATGKSKSVDGVLMYEYHCPKQHKFWIRFDEQ